MTSKPENIYQQDKAADFLQLIEAQLSPFWIGLEENITHHVKRQTYFL